MRKLRSLSLREFGAALRELEGSSAGVVYSFAAEASATKLWYDQWRSDVISAYGFALEALRIHPYFVDVTSFCRQAFDGTLPPLRCVFNLNAGVTPITHWAMMPAVAAWHGIPPLPVAADVLIVGERKDTATMLAASCGLPVPTNYSWSDVCGLPGDTQLIVKPRDLGGSVGMEKVNAASLQARGLEPHQPVVMQEFVSGLDLTVPIVFQPSTGRHRAVAGVVYLPDVDDPFSWVHDEQSKKGGVKYRKEVIPIPGWLEEKSAAFAATAELGAYSRLDLRIRTQCLDPADPAIWRGDIVFLEVNPLPTLRRDINFLNVVASDLFAAVFGEEYRIVREFVGGRPAEWPLALVLALAMTTIEGAA